MVETKIRASGGAATWAGGVFNSWASHKSVFTKLPDILRQESSPLIERQSPRSRTWPTEDLLTYVIDIRV